MDPGFDPLLLARTEDAGLNASAPSQQRVFDGWLLRLSPGKAKRARCVTPIGAGRLRLRDKLARCHDVYREAGLPLIVRITPFCLPAGLDADLDDLGYQRFDDTRVLINPDLSAMPAPGAVSPGVSVERVGSEALARIVGGMRGSPLSQQQAHAQRLSQAPVPFEAWVAKRDGQLVGCGQIAVEGDLVGLYDVFVDPDARGSGIARQLCRVLMQRGAALGATAAYLQVDADNAPALSVYAHLGFRDAYGYHYRARSGDAH